MASTTPSHRRPLATLNNNYALTPQGSRNLSRTLKGTTKSVFVDKKLFSTALGGKAAGDVEHEGRLDGGKRNASDGDHDMRSNKRQRKVGIDEEGQVQQHNQAQHREVAGRLEENEYSSNRAEKEHEIEKHGVSRHSSLH